MDQQQLQAKQTIHILYNSFNPTQHGSSDSTGADLANQTTSPSEQFEQKLIDIGEQLNSSGHSQPSIFNSLVVESVVVSSSHLAFLLDNGRVCRISYQLANLNNTSSTNNHKTDFSQHASSSGSTSSGCRSKHSKLSSVVMNSQSSSSSSSLSAAANAFTRSSSSLSSSSNAHRSNTSSSSIQQQQPISLRATDAFIIPSAHDILSSATAIGSGGATSGATSGSSSHTFRGGRRSHQLLRGRVSSLIVGSSRIPSFIPASAVPESLIENVQTVLQSKSRSVIIRELQRTNLDVNLAVNNLLQRDDEGDEPTDDEDPYIHGDDLISLLDINAHTSSSANNNNNNNDLLEAESSLFDEDSFRLSRRFGSRLTDSSSNEPNRKTSYRIRDHRWYDSYRDELFSSRLNNATANVNQNVNSSANNQTNANTNSEFNQADAKSSSASSSSTAATFSFGDNLQYWIERSGETPAFVQIASMYSELVAISVDGKLHQWKWLADTPFMQTITLDNLCIQINHPKAFYLNLWNEKIAGMSTSSLRAACWTESGKIAAWLDDSIDIPQTGKFQSAAQPFISAELTDKIVDMSTCNLFTVVRMSSGACYWWGIMPYEYRAKAVDKYLAKTQKSKSINDIVMGSYVSLKSSPLYTIGSTGFCIKNGVARIGQINEHLFSFRDTKGFKFKLKPVEQFKEMTVMPPPQPPTTDFSQAPQAPVPTQPTGSLKRKKHYSSSEYTSPCDEQKKSGKDEEETWYLPEVVFIDEIKLSTVLGKVLKVDADYVLVKMQAIAPIVPLPVCAQPVASNAPFEPIQLQQQQQQSQDILDNCRIFQKTQLQVVKQSSSNKLPDFMQRTPKKLSDFGQIITFVAHQNSVHAVVNKEGALCYVQYDLFSGKLLKEKRFTANLQSFLGLNVNSCALSSLDDVNFNIMSLFDGNATFYPLNDISGSVALKEPQWKNLFPVKCFAQSLLVPTTTSNNNKKLHYISAFCMRIEQLMSHVYRCDYNKVSKLVRQLETELAQLGSNQNSKRLRRILNERSDGNRNIIHAAVFICAPGSHKTTNATAQQDKQSTSEATNAASTTTTGFAEIYAAYGSTSTNNNTGTSSSSSINKSPISERPWSQNKDQQPIFRKINISLESIQLPSATTTQSTSQTTSTDQTANKPPTATTTTTTTTTDTTTSASSTSAAVNIPTQFWPPLPPGSSETTSATSAQSIGTPNLIDNVPNKPAQILAAIKLTDKERKQNALKILQLLLTTPLFTGKYPASMGSSHVNHLHELLSHKNADGATPFMYAVNLRAYDAAMHILDTALSVRAEMTLLHQQSNHTRDLLFTSMIFPLGSRTDQSPLFVLCSNDTCSFTWTGENHITQDIFECRTCTLVGNLCCCTECARTCHKGHDCKIKTSSPTAYCDCWEKCKCKSLVAGDQEKRFKLLDKLLNETNLLSASNTRSEHLLIYLAQTCARQLQEQKNYKRHCGSTSSASSSTSTSSSRRGQQESVLTECMPAHDLEPPKFARRALERIFADWYSLKQIFLLNHARFNVNDASDDETDSSDNDADELSDTDTDTDDVDDEDVEQMKPKRMKKKRDHVRTDIYSSLFTSAGLNFDESAYIDCQSGSIDLDKFIYILLVKCPNELLVILVETLQKKLSNDTNQQQLIENDSDSQMETRSVLKRLIRSVTRLFVVLCLETTPNNLQLNLSNNNNNNSNSLANGFLV